MKKVIGIYVFYLGIDEPYWDESSINLGGSETWANEISKEFQKRGYHVIVFGNPRNWHFSNDGVEYLPKSLFEFRCQIQKFDYFISSRTAFELSPELYADNVYIMSHEANINMANSISDLNINRIKGIACLSEWHKDMIINRYSVSKDSIFLTTNGVNTNLYNDVDFSKKENSMVWSSCRERGLDNFIKNIFPIIRKNISDFKLYICGYNDDIPNEYNDIEGVLVLGKLNKEELSLLQKKSKIWIYPNYGIDEESGFPCHETFCLTAVENGMAKNAILCGYSTGLITTLNGYSGLVGKELGLNFFENDESKMFTLNNMLASKAISLLSNNDSLMSLANEAYETVNKYTWSHAVDTWINEWNK